MPVYHDREQLIADVKCASDKMFADGLLLDCPKQRRRQQAMGDGQVRINWPKDQKKRFATQYNRFVERCSKELGIELLLQQLESLTDEEMDELREDEDSFDDDQIQMSGLPGPVMALLHDLAYDNLSRPRFSYRDRARWILRSSNGVGIEAR